MANKTYYSYGNVLMWSEILGVQHGEALPDNLGIGWNSAVYGSPVGHVTGAWLVYQHSGNEDFLKKAYEFYRELFSDGIHAMMFGLGYDAAELLSKMAIILGYPEEEA